MSSRRALIGDVFEIPTKRGLAYVQYTHENELMGGLIRVFRQLSKRRPTDSELNSFLKGPIRFSALFPVKQAKASKIFECVGNFEIHRKYRQFPIFRTGVPDFDTHKISKWSLWDGEKKWYVGQLTPEQLRYPIRGCWNDTLLIERIESDWFPEMEAE